LFKTKALHRRTHSFLESDFGVKNYTKSGCSPNYLKGIKVVNREQEFKKDDGGCGPIKGGCENILW
jgi:hypothetical protein